MRGSLVGITFNSWTVISEPHRVGRTWFVTCRCACGTERSVNKYSLMRGGSRSCGCMKNHGEAKTVQRTPEYAAWSNMKNRCYTATTPYYRDYGGRGITVCEAWRNDFRAFLHDVRRRPGSGYSLDRIDPDGNYEPGNVRWATRQTQNNNQRRPGRPLTVAGVTKRLDDWATEYGISRHTILTRLADGWSPEDAVTKPVRRRVA